MPERLRGLEWREKSLRARIKVKNVHDTRCRKKNQQTELFQQSKMPVKKWKVIYITK